MAEIVNKPVFLPANRGMENPPQGTNVMDEEQNEHASQYLLYERVGEPNILSSFVVGEPGSQNPVCPWQLYEKAASKATSAEPPPRWAIGTGQLSCLQFRSGPIARRGGGGIIPFSIFVVSGRTCPLYERVGKPNILSNLVVGEPGSQIPVRPWRLLKSRPDGRQKELPVLETVHAPGEGEEEDLHILCSVCGHIITRPSEAITIRGARHHVFANPYGLVFETACFKRAKGCVVTGRPSDEFTWFPGHQWQIALCGSCLNHLGWWFSSGRNAFFCLIIDQLIFPG